MNFVDSRLGSGDEHTRRSEMPVGFQSEIAQSRCGRCNDDAYLAR